MWQAFELMHKTFKAGAELYLEGRDFLLTPPRLPCKRPRADVLSRYVASSGQLRFIRRANHDAEPCLH